MTWFHFSPTTMSCRNRWRISALGSGLVLLILLSGCGQAPWTRGCWRAEVIELPLQWRAGETETVPAVMLLEGPNRYTRGSRMRYGIISDGPHVLVDREDFVLDWDNVPRGEVHVCGDLRSTGLIAASWLREHFETRRELDLRRGEPRTRPRAMTSSIAVRKLRAVGE
jgi:hypothetical protein